METENLYIYLTIVGVLLIIFLFNSRRNKMTKKERKSRSFKQSYYERKKADRELKEKD